MPDGRCLDILGVHDDYPVASLDPGTWQGYRFDYDDADLAVARDLLRAIEPGHD